MHKINTKNFRRFGWVIEYPKKTPRNKRDSFFKVILTEKRKVGWRIAYLLLRDKTLDKLERHVDSFESFEPVKGRSLIFVSRGRNHKKIKIFFLDKPVILDKGIWHGVVALGRESEIKITENAKLRCDYWHIREETGNVKNKRQ